MLDTPTDRHIKDTISEYLSVSSIKLRYISGAVLNKPQSNTIHDDE